jgi:hypothetical protein
MELIIQEIVDQKTVDVKMKFVALTGKINDTKNKQLANIAKQDKDARAALVFV